MNAGGVVIGRTGHKLVVAWLCAPVMAVAGCVPTPEGCNALDSGDECQHDACGRAGRAILRCHLSPCGNRLDAQRCPSDRSYCVDTGTGLECASAPTCAATEVCKTEGRCGELEGRCVATAQGCAESVNCRERGLCELRSGICAPTETSCATATVVCGEYGRCGFGLKECVATPEGCAHSTECRRRGTCGFSENECVPTVEGCAESAACVDEGQCGYLEGRCTPTAEGCAESARCVEEGQCGYVGAWCIPTAQGCAESTACATAGVCGFTPRECTRTTVGCEPIAHCVFTEEGCVGIGYCHVL